MVLASGRGELSDLKAPQVRAAPELERELVVRLAPPDLGRPVSVTDLLEPRRAFWRRTKGPAPLPPERRARLEAGRGVHRSIDLALPDEGIFEVRLRRSGVSARVDLLADVPVEIKTGHEPLPSDVARERPEYLEQVAIYCSLLERDAARLVHVRLDPEHPPTVESYDVSLKDPGRVAAEVGDRAEFLRAALSSGNAGSLPRCRWYRLGCDFRSAGFCDCTGEEPAGSESLVDAAGALLARPDVQRRWETALASPRFGTARPVVRKYRDLVYPRRAYFAATEPSPTTGPSVSVADYPASDVYDLAVGALESGPVGDVHRLKETIEGPEEEVAGWRGEPYLIRTSRARDRLRPEEAFVRFPQYALELGFRCAVTGTRQGRVVLAYERANDPAGRLQVLDYDFADAIEGYAAAYDERRKALASALTRRDPAQLAPCATWMVAGCPYRDRCGCGSDAGRSQR